MNISFEDLEEKLKNGFQIYFYYDNHKYLLFMTKEDCYTLLLQDIPEKNPLPVKQIITEKMVKEMHPFMKNIEYKYEN